MSPCRPKKRPPSRDCVPTPVVLARAIQVPTMRLQQGKRHEKALIAAARTGRQAKEFDLVVEVGDEEGDDDELGGIVETQLPANADQDDDDELPILASNGDDPSDDAPKQEERAANPWLVIRKTKPQASRACRKRPLTVGKTKFDGVITVAVVSRLEDFSENDALKLLGYLKTHLLLRFEDKELLDQNDWLHIRLAFAPALNSRKTLVYVHFENFLRDRVGAGENMHRNLVLCGRGLPDDFEETGMSLNHFVPNYARHLKHELIIDNDDPLYPVLFLLARDIYIRNVQPIWLDWPDDVELVDEEEEQDEEVGPSYEHDIIIPKSADHVPTSWSPVLSTAESADDTMAKQGIEIPDSEDGKHDNDLTDDTAVSDSLVTISKEEEEESSDTSDAEDSNFADSEAETTILTPTRRRPTKRIVSDSSSSTEAAPTTADTDTPESWGAAAIIKPSARGRQQRHGSGRFIGGRAIQEAKEHKKKKWAMPTLSGPGFDEPEEELTSNRATSGTWRQRKTILSSDNHLEPADTEIESENDISEGSSLNRATSALWRERRTIRSDDDTETKGATILPTVEAPRPRTRRKVRKSGGQIVEESTSEDEPIVIKKARQMTTRLVTPADSTDGGAVFEQTSSKNAEVSMAASFKPPPCPFDEGSSDENISKRPTSSKNQYSRLGGDAHETTVPRWGIRKSDGMVTDAETDNEIPFAVRVKVVKRQLAPSHQPTPNHTANLQSKTTLSAEQDPKPSEIHTTDDRTVSRPSMFGSVSTLTSVESKIRPDLVGQRTENAGSMKQTPKARRTKPMPDMGEIMRRRLKKSIASRKRVLLDQGGGADTQSLFVKKRKVETQSANTTPTRTIDSDRRRVFATGGRIDDQREVLRAARKEEIETAERQGSAMPEPVRQKPKTDATVAIGRRVSFEDDAVKAKGQATTNNTAKAKAESSTTSRQESPMPEPGDEMPTSTKTKRVIKFEDWTATMKAQKAAHNTKKEKRMANPRPEQKMTFVAWRRPTNITKGGRELPETFFPWRKPTKITGKEQMSELRCFGPVESSRSMM